MSLEIGDLQRSSYEVAVGHGFWEEGDLSATDIYRMLIPQKLMLIVSEAAEALDNVRDGTLEQNKVLWLTDKGKPEGFASELADIIIRTLDLAEYLQIDMEDVIRQKEAYNKTRPPKHGKTI